MSRYTQEELAQMTVADIEAQMSPEEIAQMIQRIMATGEAAFETRHRGKDGRIIDVEVAIRYLPHGEGGLFYGFLRDITERKRVEINLKQSESMLAEAQRLARLGNWDWNILTNELTWSDEVYRLFGISPQ